MPSVTAPYFLGLTAQWSYSPILSPALILQNQALVSLLYSLHPYSHTPLGIYHVIPLAQEPICNSETFFRRLFSSLAIITKAAVNICVQAFVETSFRLPGGNTTERDH